MACADGDQLIEKWRDDARRRQVARPCAARVLTSVSCTSQRVTRRTAHIACVHLSHVLDSGFSSDKIATDWAAMALSLYLSISRLVFRGNNLARARGNKQEITTKRFSRDQFERRLLVYESKKQNGFQPSRVLNPP
ncbi:hypothetical protein J6590_069427 [Homalodisca vitripennis]|nr:hypothetical protein J6590_069427 [Homalodisca vitripennis]